MTIKNILWTTDGSKQSENAFVYAKYFAKIFNSKIFGLHVVPIFLKIIRENLVNHKEIETDLLNRISGKYDKQFYSIVEDLKRKSINFLGTVLTGIPNNQIVSYRKDGIDLIVMNSSGNKGLEKIILGSVAEKVVQNADCPVLVLKN